MARYFLPTHPPRLTIAAGGLREGIATVISACRPDRIAALLAALWHRPSQPIGVALGCAACVFLFGFALAHQSGFTDVPVTHPAHDQIEMVTERNLMSGFPDGSFRPNQPASKEEERAALVRLLGEAGADAIWNDLKGAKGGRPLARFELAVLLSRIDSGEKIDFRKPLDLARFGDRPTQRSSPERRKPPPRKQRSVKVGTEPCTEAGPLFAGFGESVRVTCDSQYMYIQSDGMADHRMMVGITQTNQQVPLPQDYKGANAWRIPLRPRRIDRPAATFDGPIGVAVNGVPIFDPTKQGGVGDAKQEGELDVCNGHAGRADDYHYHAAPVCLFPTRLEASTVVGFALDGYPIHGFVDEAGSRAGLDSCNGTGSGNAYRYHVSEAHPYVIGCFRGAVDMNDQPQTRPIRPPGEPVRHVEIIRFVNGGANWWSQVYRAGSITHTIQWKPDGEQCWDFRFTRSDRGGIRRERYCRKASARAGNPPPRPGRANLHETGLDTTGRTALTADVWVDNWFKLYVNGKPLIEDSVSIHTERSFNAEHFSFRADPPFTFAFEFRDFMENETGLEYIGTGRQQMGDGGAIAQFRNSETGAKIAVTDGQWRCLTVQYAPIETSCARERRPKVDTGACAQKRTRVPDGWTMPDFDDSKWAHASVHSVRAVRPKGGYDRVYWQPSAKFIWGPDLKRDNVLLCRLTVR